jgi:hypothetical protein
VGHNPPCGNSHFSDALNAQMQRYFTADKVVALYRRAQELGVKTLMIRGDFRMLDWLEQYRRAGGRMNVIGQTASEMHDVFTNIRIMAAAGVGGIYHHGTQTDKFWREGRIDDCLPYLRCMRACGVAVGLGTHQPEIIEYAQEHGWDVDFYMACFYNLSRVARESAMVTGKTDYEREQYVPEDRARMCRVIAQVDKPVLAFKILAAGRLCATPQAVREAFSYAFSHIKPIDGVVVGLFPKDNDQTALDVQHAQEACAALAAK